MKEVIFTKNIPICPKCEVATVRVFKGTSTTSLARIWEYDEEGNEISQDPNIITSYYHCKACNQDYGITTRGKQSQYL